jgi:hypothetical protein
MVTEVNFAYFITGIGCSPMMALRALNLTVIIIND